MLLEMPPEAQRIVLALSGGGFRATIFHLGVIRYLRDSRRLQNVTHIASVSGGSIIAAHLVLQWAKFTGDEQAFSSAANALIGLAKTDVWGQIFWGVIIDWGLLIALCVMPVVVAWYWQASWKLWLGVPTWWLVLWFFHRSTGRPRSRIQRLQAAYESALFKGYTLPSLRVNGAPQIMIAATDLTTGDLVYFSHEGIHTTSDGKVITTSRPSVAMAVAASSAFPPAFPPIEISKDILQVDASALPNSHFLADGGVFDNLGSCLADLVKPAGAQLVISSAEPLPDSDIGARFGLLWRRAERSTNILMQRVSDNQYRTHEGARYILLKDEIHGIGVETTVQQQIRKTRTDLRTAREITSGI